MTKFRLAAALLLALCAALPAREAPTLVFAPEFPDEGLRAGDTLRFRAAVPEPWRVFSHESEDEFFPPFRAEIRSEGALFGDPLFGETVRAPLFSGDSGSFYADEILIALPVAAVPEGGEVSISLRTSWLACTDEECAEEAGAEVEYLLPVASPSRLPLLLLFAFLGGMVLNVMPCVLPVLGLKVYRLVEQRRLSRGRRAALGGAFVAGVEVSFLVLALVVVALKAAGEEAGWGFQMQNPAFLAGMVAVLGLFAYNLFGLFEISLHAGAAAKMDSASKGEGLWASFAGGAFMTLLSTPCSAPLLGSSMGWALGQRPALVVLFYAVAGLGLALPFFAISCFPGKLRAPKPGRWMHAVRAAMGLLLLLTAAWLVSVLAGFGAGLARGAVLFLAVSALVLALRRRLMPDGGLSMPAARRRGGNLATAFLLVLSFAAAVGIPLSALPDAPSAETESGEPGGAAAFSAARVDSLRAAGRDVFVDFTAAWCLTCKANEKFVLSDKRIRERFEAGRPVLLVGDFTARSPEIAAELRRFGRAGVPLYVYYPASGEPAVLPEVLTAETVLSAFGAE